jgi:hypothetical protein
MVLESNAYGVREERIWCQRVTLMVLESHGYGVRAVREHLALLDLPLPRAL